MRVPGPDSLSGGCLRAIALPAHRTRELVVAELAFGGLVDQIVVSDSSNLGLSVFPSAVCRHNSVHVRAGGPVRSSVDLALQALLETACLRRVMVKIETLVRYARDQALTNRTVAPH